MKIRKIQILYMILFLWILFNNYLETVIPIFSYFDEGIALYSILYIILNLKKNMKGDRLYILYSTAAIVLIGIAGDILFHYNANMIVVVKDIISFIKAPLAIIAFSIYFEKHNTDSALKTACAISKVIIIIMSVLYILSQFINTGMLYDVRRGIISYKFIYTHPTFFVYSVVIMLSCFVAEGISKKNVFYQILGIILLILSMRDKAFAFVALYLTVIVIFPNRNRIRIRYIMIAVFATLFVTRNKLSLYASYSWSPRYAMYTTGFHLLKDCFPIGSGLGTFASNLSGEYYSRLYSIYGFADRAGVMEGDYVNLGDAGLPYYFGQFGITGFIFFCIIIYCLYRIIFYVYFSDKNKRMASLLIVGYSMIALFVENFFCNETGSTVFIILFVFLGRAKNDNGNSFNKGNQNHTIYFQKAI